MIPGSGKSPGEGIVYALQFSWAFMVAQIWDQTQVSCTAGEIFTSRTLLFLTPLLILDAPRLATRFSLSCMIHLSSSMHEHSAPVFILWFFRLQVLLQMLPVGEGGLAKIQLQPFQQHSGSEEGWGEATSESSSASSQYLRATLGWHLDPELLLRQGLWMRAKLGKDGEIPSQGDSRPSLGFSVRGSGIVLCA